MHIVNKRDFLASIVLLAMLGFYVESTRIETQGGVDLGPLFFPHLMVIVIAILSVVLLFKSISFSPAGKDQKAAPEKIFCTTKDQTIFIAPFFIYLMARLSSRNAHLSHREYDLSREEGKYQVVCHLCLFHDRHDSDHLLHLCQGHASVPSLIPCTGRHGACPCCHCLAANIMIPNSAVA